MKHRVLRRLVRFLRPYGWALVWTNLLALVAPMLSGWAVDAIGKVPGGVDFGGVVRNCAAMLVCYALSSLLNYLVSARLIRLGQAVSYDLRKAAFDRMSELPVEYFDTHPAGDLISRICYDAVSYTHLTLPTNREV